MHSTVTPVTLDAEHRYWLNGRELDGCTATLGAVGLIDRSHYTAEACARGSYVHEAIHADFEGEIINDLQLDPARFGYLLAARGYLAESGFVPIDVEVPLADAIYGIAGKPDVIGRIGNRFTILDWKTGDRESWHGIQLAFYEHLARTNGRIVGLADRVAVYLRGDGTYTSHRFLDRNDWRVAQAAVTIVQAKRGGK